MLKSRTTMLPPEPVSMTLPLALTVSAAMLRFDTLMALVAASVTVPVAVSTKAAAGSALPLMAPRMSMLRSATSSKVVPVVQSISARMVMSPGSLPQHSSLVSSVRLPSDRAVSTSASEIVPGTRMSSGSSRSVPKLPAGARRSVRPE